MAGRHGAVLPVQRLLDTFERWWPDRDALARRSGWAREEIDTIDVYRGSAMTLIFPSRDEILARLPPGIGDAQLQPCGHYDLAACCPILTFRRR